MGKRADSVGMFWEDTAIERGGYERPRPPVPDTGWKPPRDFPDLSAAKVIAIDTETKDMGLQLGLGPGVRRDDSYIAGVSIGTEDGHRAYYPIRHEGGGNLDPDIVFRYLNDQLGRARQPKCGANLLYDLDWLAEEGVTVRADRFLDVQIAEPLIDENQYSFALDKLGHKYLSEGKVDEELYKWCSMAFGGDATRKKQAGNIWRAPIELVGPYAESDVDLPLRIFEKQRLLLEQQDLMPVFEMESDLMPVLLAMRRHGIRVDQQRAEEVGNIMLAKEAEAQMQLDNIVGFQVKVWTNGSLAMAFDKMSEHYPRTAKGNPSFRKEWLEQQTSPMCELVLAVRKWSKAKSTFIDGHIQGHAINGRVHAQFHQLRTDENGAVSGRLSSSDPNLQNIPARDPELCALLRSLFLPDEGCEYVRYDWSQIEYRFLVHYARGPSGQVARDLYNSDPTTSFHVMTHDRVQDVTGIDLDYKPVKNLNFGLTYGMGKPKMTRSLGLTTEGGDELFNAYHAGVPFVKETFNYASRIAEKRGYVKTILGRRRRFHVFESRDWEQAQIDGPVSENYARDQYGANGYRRAMCHKALNAVMQGGSAELMKKSMVDQHKAGIYEVLGPPLLTVHDELGLNDQGTPEAREAHREARYIMENAIKLDVPILVDVERGPNWGNLKEIT